MYHDKFIHRDRRRSEDYTRRTYINSRRRTSNVPASSGKAPLDAKGAIIGVCSGVALLTIGLCCHCFKCYKCEFWERRLVDCGVGCYIIWTWFSWCCSCFSGAFSTALSRNVSDGADDRPAASSEPAQNLPGMGPVRGYRANYTGENRNAARTAASYQTNASTTETGQLNARYRDHGWRVSNPAENVQTSIGPVSLTDRETTFPARGTVTFPARETNSTGTTESVTFHNSFAGETTLRRPDRETTFTETTHNIEAPELRRDPYSNTRITSDVAPPTYPAVTDCQSPDVAPPSDAPPPSYDDAIRYSIT